MVGFKLKTVGFLIHYTSFVDKMVPDVFLSIDASVTNIMQE